jgi:5-methylthioadenosine/S-adenosylhomocysteine deaminase
MAVPSGLKKTLPGLVNAHTHSPLAPLKGLTRSRPFEQWFMERPVRQGGAPPSPEMLAACALAGGLENLACGNTAIIDHVNVPQTKEHVYAIANAYEALGIRAWVLVDATDLPRTCYTTEAYPRYPKAIPTAELSPELQALVSTPPPYPGQLAAIREIITGWKGTRVKLGVAMSNAVWCSDGLLADGAALARELDVPIAIHAEESPVQREVCLAQWGESGIQRLKRFGVLSPKTIVAHVAQIDEADIATLADSGASVSHNPTSNLKLQNGIAPVGAMLRAGVNVCVGTDGSSSGDDQDLYSVLRFVAGLARVNGLQDLEGGIEEWVVRMATEHGYKLWFDASASQDHVSLSQAVGAFAAVWANPSRLIDEVFIDRKPVLASARAAVASTDLSPLHRAMEEGASAERSELADRLTAVTARYARAR